MLVVYLLSILVDSIQLKLIFLVLAVLSLISYIELYGKIEIYIPVKPEYDFNEFLNKLRNQNSS